MHPNPVFRTETDAANIAFARERGFGALAVNACGVPLVSHLPFLLAEDGSHADLHLVRSNPIARALASDPTVLHARFAVSGPDSYISPDWYEADDQVPTWNYVAVHLTGRLEALPADALREILDRQTALYEEWLQPKQPWTTTKMTRDVLDRLMRSIAPFRFTVDAIEGTWKLNQNKAEAQRLNAAAAVEAYGQGQELSQLAALMRGVDSGT